MKTMKKEAHELQELTRIILIFFFVFFVCFVDHSPEKYWILDKNQNVLRGRTSCPTWRDLIE
jgi:hypothetical protein